MGKLVLIAMRHEQCLKARGALMHCSISVVQRVGLVLALQVVRAGMRCCAWQSSVQLSCFGEGAENDSLFAFLNETDRPWLEVPSAVISQGAGQAT